MTAVEDQPPNPSEGRRRSPVVLAVLVLALVVASGVAIWQSLRLADTQDDVDRRADAVGDDLEKSRPERQHLFQYPAHPGAGGGGRI